MRNYWLSTPRFTCWVQIDAAAIVRGSAPYLRRWRGKPCRPLLAETMQRYGRGQCQFVLLDAPAQGELFATDHAPQP